MVYALGMEDKIPGAAVRLETGTPSKDLIIKKILEILK